MTAPGPRPHSGFRGQRGGGNPVRSPLHPTVSWPLSLGTRVGVGLLIKPKLSPSGLSLAPVTARGRPLAGSRRDIFHHRSDDTLRSRHSAGGAVVALRAVGTRGRQEVLSGERGAAGGGGCPVCNSRKPGHRGEGGAGGTHATSHSSVRLAAGRALASETSATTTHPVGRVLGSWGKE